MNRNLTVTLPALLAISILMVALALIGFQKPKEDAPSESDATSSMNSLNERQSSARSVLCPSIKTGITSNSSLFHRKDDIVSLSSWFLGLREAVVGCDGLEYWFWMRSFDAKSVYFCDREKLERTTLRPIMRPEVLIMIAWIGEIETAQEVRKSNAGFVAVTKKGAIDIIVEFDQEKIRTQTAISEGVPIVTLEGDDFAEFSGLILPKRIRAFWHEERLFGEFVIEKWVINADDPVFLPPKGLRRINLEDYSSSSTKSVFAFSSPTLGDQ